LGEPLEAVDKQSNGNDEIMTSAMYLGVRMANATNSASARIARPCCSSKESIRLSCWVISASCVQDFGLRISESVIIGCPPVPVKTSSDDSLSPIALRPFMTGSKTAPLKMAPEQAVENRAVLIALC
jgi:hypothetical protein